MCSKDYQSVKTGLRNEAYKEIHGDTENTRNLLGLLSYCEVTANDISKALYKKVPELRQYMFSKNSLRTQRIESDILVNICADLRHDNIEPFLVHDGFYVPANYVRKYKRLLKKYTRIECEKYKAELLSNFLDIDPTKFVKNMDSILNNNRNTHQSHSLYKSRRSYFSFFIEPCLGTNYKNIKNLETLSIWDSSDIVKMNNLNRKNLCFLKNKFTKLVKHGKSFTLNKLFTSLYIYAKTTGKHLVNVNDINFLILVIKDSKTKNQKVTKVFKSIFNKYFNDNNKSKVKGEEPNLPRYLYGGKTYRVGGRVKPPDKGKPPDNIVFKK